MFLRTFLVPLAAIILLAGCSRRSSETAAVTPEIYDVVLVPTEEFPLVEAQKVAATVGQETGLKIKVFLPLGTRDWNAYPDRPQYNPDALFNLASPVIDRLKTNYGGKIYAILTVRDIGPSDKSLNFLFTYNDPNKKISVISAARILSDDQGKQASAELIQTRLHKLLLRTIALQYYELQRSADIQDITYSPLMGVPDLDQMGLRLLRKAQTN